MQHLTLGIDIACRAAHQASLADDKGDFLWSGRRFRSSRHDLEALWTSLPADSGGHGRDGAHPQRLGRPRIVVRAKRGQSGDGPLRAIR